MGAGHSFLVLEGPLSEDTHSLDPAPDKSGGPPPDFFFFKPLFAIYIYLPLFFLLTPPISFFFLFFFLHIGILVIVAIAVIVKTSLDFLPASQASLS